MSDDRVYSLADQKAEASASRWMDSVQLLDSVVSTQEVAKELAENGALEGTTVIAEEQTGARGRMGRKWFSPRGKGIWMSIVLRPELPLSETPQLTLLAGVAVCKAIRRVTSVEAGIKWPNDLLAGGRKICGILLESSLREGKLQYCIAGIGISANMTEADYPEHLMEVATSLRIQRGGVPVDRLELAEAVLDELERHYHLYMNQGFKPIKELWESMSVTLGRQIALNSPQGRVEGVVVGLDEMGGLLLRSSSGEISSVCSGEIELL